MKEQTAQHQSKKTFLSTPTLLITVAVIGLLMLGVWMVNNNQDDSSSTNNALNENQTFIEMAHIHGLGFSADGRELFVPAHTGLVVFSDNRWHIPDILVNDYMGYTAVDDGFYSSGHPGVGTDLINPLGLVKSTDGGSTLTTLDFSGESDFHVMGVGYKNHTIYVLNPSSNSKLPAGMHYSLDDGVTWEACRAERMPGEVLQIAVHPTDANIVAVATQNGVFLSQDYGATFAPIGESVPIAAVAFDSSGESLFFGYQTLHRYSLVNEQMGTLPTPTFTTEDGIGYIALNPVSSSLVFATFNKDIYLSEDTGQAWEQIAQQGIGRNP
ncbi:MAG: glycosyl hydrolase [Anaerolineae bacterium]|nr:glycosyl hydrolase [Anaerolineae bacterium]